MSRPNQHARYCYALAVIMFSIYTLTIAINAYIDPRGFFLRSSEAVGRYFEFPSRAEKSIRLHNEQYDVLVLGSSRVEVGIDPLSKSFANQSVYNLGLSATNMYELHKVIDYAIKHQSPEIMIMGLDFLMFTSQRELHKDFNGSLFSPEVSYSQLAAQYLSDFSVLKESLLTVYYRYQGHTTKVVNARGYLDKADTHVIHRELFDQILTQNFLVRHDTYAGYQHSKQREQLFADSIEKILVHGVELKIFISPIHARQEEALVVTGLYETYENWKKEIVNIIAEQQRRHNKKIHFCDYSGYTSITTEDVPSDSATKMQWYWESSHYKKALGDLIIDDLLSTNKVSPLVGNCQLNSENIAAHLENIRARQQAYGRSHEFEVSEVRRLYNETASIRANNLRKNDKELKH